ncbi:MAG TPA: hypothetical protein VF163_22955, partial [Micromonosporaceae bacterium]
MVAPVGVRVAAPLAVVVGVLLTLAGPAVAAEAEPSTPRLAVTPSAPSYRPGEPVTLRATVTNQAGTACTLVKAADATIQVVDANRDGTALSPSYARALIGASARHTVTHQAERAAPGATVAFELQTRPNGSIDTMTPLPGGPAFIASWPVTAEGEYELRLLYQVPALAGDDACAGASDLVTVRFAVTRPGPPWWLVAAVGAGALAAIVILVWLILRRRRRGNRTATVAVASALALFCSAGLLALDAHEARATLSPGPNLTGPILDIYTGCISKITAADPDLIVELTKPGSPEVTVWPWTWSGHQPKKGGGPRDSTVFWDPFDTSGFAGEPKGGAALDPCASLYHELVHAL